MSTPVVVVIGVGGMGRQIARRQGQGAHLVLADFDEQLLANAAEELHGEGYDVTTVPVDVSKRPSVQALVQRAASRGPVIQVVHTAGLSPVQAPAEAILAVDLLGVAFVLEEFAEVIVYRGAGVVIASMAGHFTPLPAEFEDALRRTPADDLLALPALQKEALPAENPGGAAYSIAKRANVLRVQAATGAWGVRGARINSISSGVISTPMGRAELESESGATMRGMIAMSGTGRVGTPTDIADAAAFLLGPHASFVTGTDLLVDGGVVAAVRSRP